jgi:O-antigen/teichoic acid export membrane protein
MFRSNIAYALGSAANSAALLLLIPYLINVLPADAYGAWAIYEIGIVFLTIIMIAGFDIGLMREYWAEQDEQKRKSLAGSIFILVLTWSVILALGLWFGAGLLQMLVCTSPEGCVLLRLDWLALVLLIAPAETLFNLLLSIFRIRERAMTFAALSFSRLLLFLILAIAGIQLNGSLTGGLAGRLGATIIALLIAFVVAHNYLKLSFSWPMTRGVILYGLPMLPANIASYVLVASDRFILQSFTTLEIVAIYAFVYKIGTALEVLVIRPFALDWAPRRFKIATQPDAKAQYAEVLVLYLFVASGVALLILAGAPLLYLWFAPPLYAAGLPLLGVLLAAQVINGATYPLNIGMMLKDRTRYIPVIVGLSAAICLGLNFWWISFAGMAGAAWATLVSYSVLAVLMTVTSQWLYPVKYSAIRLVAVLGAICCVGFGLFVLEQLLAGTSLITLTLLKALWIIAVFGLLGYMLWMQGGKFSLTSNRHSDTSLPHLE